MKKTHKPKTLRWKLKKYHRWMRLYMRRVKSTEREMGGEISPC